MVLSVKRRADTLPKREYDDAISRHRESVAGVGRASRAGLDIWHYGAAPASGP